MGILRRYVVFETLQSFGVALIALLLVMTLGGGVKEAWSQGLPLDLMLSSLAYILPESLRFLLPGCLLFAVCSVFGRMAAANEIVAIKSLGISPLRVIWPVLALAYLLSILTFELYDVCAVWGRPGLRQLVTGSLDRIAYSVLEKNRSFSRPGLSIIVKGVDGGQLLQPLITLDPRDGKPSVTLTARTATLRTDPEKGTLHLEAEDGQLDLTGKGSFSFPDRIERDIVINPPDPEMENHLSPAELWTRVIPGQIAREERLVAELAAALAIARREHSPQADQLSQQHEGHRARWRRLQAEIPRRLSNGFGCLCFALIGIPVAMRRRSSDILSVFFVCFAPILVVYYPLLVLGEHLARDGYVPLLSVWLADGVLLAVGVALLWRGQKH